MSATVLSFPEPQDKRPAQQAKELVGLVLSQVVCDLANNGVDINDPEVHNALGAVAINLKSIAAHHYDLNSMEEISHDS